MSTIHREPPLTGVLLALGGVLLTAFGCFAFGQRQEIAALFLGADFLFGIPVTQNDSWKMQLVGGESILAAIGGALLMISGTAIALIRSRRARAQQPGTAPIPHFR